MGISWAQDEWSRGRGQPGRLMPQRCPLSGVVSATRTFATSAIVNCAASPHARIRQMSQGTAWTLSGGVAMMLAPCIVQWGSFAQHISRSRISGCQKGCLHPAFLAGMRMSDVRENPESAYDMRKCWYRFSTTSNNGECGVLPGIRRMWPDGVGGVYLAGLFPHSVTADSMWPFPGLSGIIAWRAGSERPT